VNLRRGLAAASAGVLACLAAVALPAAPALAGDGRSAGQPADRTVVVDTDQVVQSDYLGVGVNVIPWSLMGDTAALGYDEADWEVDVERILTIQPKVARVWFQIDWMELEKGVYDFQSPEMQAFDRYLQAFEQAGTEVELNFGWKVGERVHDWFTIPGAPDPYISAPADLEAYGHSASALLDELVNVRGYDHVKYLTFYNEPNGSWDFWAPGDEKAYYAEMANAVDAQLEADGLRELVEIWGPEEVSAPEWTAYMQQHAGDTFDGYSFHLYGEAFDQLDEAIAARQSVAGGKPVHLTEMGWTNPGTSVWETGYANYLIGSANQGITSNLVWQLNGTMTDDPRGDTNGAFNLWDSLILGLEPTAAYYEAGPLMRYIPAHSEVLATTVSDPDLRAAAYRAADGELTVLVETQGTAEHDVRVEFEGDRVNERFHRIAFTDADAVIERNAILPASSGELKAKRGAFTDTLPAEHGYALYTTAEPAAQVAVDPVQSEIVAGSQVQLSASVIDGAKGKARFDWTVVGEGNGTIDRHGRYTAPEVDAERTVAIRATSARDDGAYGVAQVTVLPAHREGVTDAPVFSLAPGVHESAEAVFISSTTQGATIHYTTDGSEPTTASPVYDGPVFLTGGTVYLRALAIADGLEPSSTTSRLYKVLGQQIAPDGYEFCAYADRGECAFDGEASVAFGSDGLFAFGTFTDGVECTAANFGGDPNPGGDNRCFVNPDAPEEPPLVTIYNAGFESPETGGTANGPMVNGWTFSARSGVQHNDSVFNPAFPAPEGERTAYLKTDSGLGSRIEQTVTFPAGRFAIEFQAANRADFGGLQEIDVELDGQVVGSFAPDASGQYVLVTTDAFDVEAGQHTIAFVGTTTEGDNTAFVDAVRVVEAP
jgi:hypothetical protein